jgi:hypothetical protein
MVKEAEIDDYLDLNLRWENGFSRCI